MNESPQRKIDLKSWILGGSTAIGTITDGQIKKLLDSLDRAWINADECRIESALEPNKSK